MPVCPQRRLRLKELLATRSWVRRKLLFCNRRRVHPKQADQRQSLLIETSSSWSTGADTSSKSEPTSLLGHIRHKVAGVEQQDYFSVNLDFSPTEAPGSGTLAVIGCGDYISESMQESLAYRRPADLKVVCERGIAFVDLPNTVAWFDEAGQHLETLDHERPVGEQLLIHFHRAVASLVLKSSSLADAHRAISIANLAKASCDAGSRVAC